MRYKQLMTEKQFLKVRERAMKLSGSELIDIYLEDNTLWFETLSGTDYKTIWVQTVEMEGAGKINIGTKPRDAENIVRDADLKIYCDCPAFLYWGYKYMAYKGGYGTEKETRPPVVRNPKEKGYLCKHLFQVMTVFPFLTSNIAKQLRNGRPSKGGEDKAEPKEPTGSTVDEQVEQIEQEE